MQLCIANRADVDFSVNGTYHSWVKFTLRTAEQNYALSNISRISGMQVTRARPAQPPHRFSPPSLRSQVRQAIKFQYTDWAAEADEAAAAEARFGRAADFAADSQFVCPLEDVLGTLSSGGDDSDTEGVHIFRSEPEQALN